MGKRTKKLLVYLDQNFLSEMSKADINEKVRPEFKEIYELLHQGFTDEKLVVPSSLLHDIESSLATHLKDRINTYQHYLGQVRLRMVRTKSRTPKSPRLSAASGVGTLKMRFDPKAAFLDDPDQRVEQFGISVDAHWETHNFRTQPAFERRNSLRPSASNAASIKNRLRSAGRGRVGDA